MVAELLPEAAVAMAFLELCEPVIEDGIARLRDQGCREVVVAPLLLFAAGHARQDVPAAVREAADRHGLAARQADVLGLHADLVRCARRRLQEAADGAVGPVRTVFVGRGASDPTVPSQMAAFGRLVLAGPRGGEESADSGPGFGIGFVAAARPTLDEAMEAAASAGGGESPFGSADASACGHARRSASPPRTVVVHPHLLFRGHVEAQVAARVEQARRDHPGVAWRVSRRLGADPLVARAVIDRALETALSPQIRTRFGPVDSSESVRNG
jgi:sirohydrochlorin cobaltochelatase